MTGSGTSSNPFVITTAEDLYLVADEGSQSKYFKLGADIDFTGTSYAKNFSSLRIKFRSFDGCGHTIRGIYKNAVGSSFNLFNDSSTSNDYAPVTIKNLTLEAEILADTIRIFNYTNTTSTYNITNCTFILNCTGGAPDTGGLINTDNLAVNFSYSTLILNADLSSARPLMMNGSFTGSQVRSDTVLRASDSSVTDNALWHGVTMADTGFFGTVDLRDGSENTGSVLWAYGGTHGNAYQVIEYRNIAEALWDGNISTVCFFDSEKCGSAEVKNTVSEEQNMLIHSLTTAQCTDAEYLRSIGYVCEGEA